jgi:hypothetical protein
MNKTSQTVTRRVFAHLNGLAVGSVAQGLLETDILERLFKDSQKKISVDALIAHHGVVSGYTKLALETLCLAGFLHVEEDANELLSLEVTPKGKTWLNFRSLYGKFNELLTRSLEAHAHAYLRRDLNHEKSYFNNDISTLVQMHLYAPSICLMMQMFAERKGLEDTLKDKNSSLWLDILRKEDWLSSPTSGGAYTLNGAGQTSIAFAPLYAYPLSYFPLLRQIPDLLIGQQTNTPTVDRALDISFSGKVFKGSCRSLFFDQVLPLFDTQDISSQPKVIVDTGCGDATVLIETYQAIRRKTSRGQQLQNHPLLLVGVEYEVAAINVAKQRLEQEKLPHLVISGDIGKPADIHKTLSQHNIHHRDVLHISKSVVHNRMFTYSTTEHTSPSKVSCSSMSCVDAQGKSIPNRLLFFNLVAFFRLWLPWMSHHGMIVMESHGWSQKVSQVVNDDYPMNLVNTTHSFSKQYLVPAEFYEGALALSGLVTAKTDSIFAVPGCPPTMTVKHLKAC